MPDLVPTVESVTSGMDDHVSGMSTAMSTTSEHFSPMCSISGAFSSMVSGVESGIGSMVSGLEGLVSSVTKKMADAWSTVQGWYEQFKTWVSGKISALMSPDTSPSEKSTIMVLLDKAKTWGNDILGGIKSAYDWVAGKVGGMVQDMTKAVSGAFGAAKLSGCNDMKEGMNALPAENQSADVKSALASNGKTPDQVIGEHLAGSPAVGSVSDFHAGHEEQTNKMTNLPTISDETIMAA